MNENKNEKNKTVYNIPGVIIPEQKTENGEVISSANNIAEQEVKEELKPVEQQIQQVQQPVQQPVQPVIPPQPVPTIQQVNETPKLVEPVNKNNKKKKFSIKINNYTVIIFVLLLALVYLIYDDFINVEKPLDPVKEYQKQKAVNKTSFVAQQLFDYVNLDGCGEQINFFYNQNQVVKYSDLTDENKNYLAYRMLKHESIETKNCTTYSTALNKNDKEKTWYCGDYANETKEDKTTVIKGEDIEDQVNKMFGDGSYKATTFKTSNTGRYLYDSKTNSYIYQSYDGSNSCDITYTNILDRVYRQKDQITIVVKTKNNKK